MGKIKNYILSKDEIIYSHTVFGIYLFADKKIVYNYSCCYMSVINFASM